MTCEHLEFAANVEVFRLTSDGKVDPHAFAAEITVVCADCGAAFGWKGPPVGLSSTEPRVSRDALVLRAPLMTPAEMELAGPLHATERGPMRWEASP
jgi:hypothetical protein